MVEPKLLIETMKSFWEWVKEDANNWVTAMANPQKFLASLNLETDEALNVSLRLSAFSIVLGVLCQVPAQIAFVPKQVSGTQILTSVVIEYTEILIAALSLKMAVALFRGAARIRECIILSLVMSVYVALKALVSIPLLSDPKRLQRYESGDVLQAFSEPRLFFMWLVSLALFAFIGWQYLRACKYIANVGWTRGSCIALVAVIAYGSLQVGFIHPIEAKLFELVVD